MRPIRSTGYSHSMSIRRGLAGFVAAAVALSLSVTALPSPATAADTSMGTREAALAAWKQVQPLFAMKPSWTGSVQSCTAGVVNEDFTVDTLRMLNYVRALAGVRPVTWDPQSIEQQAAQQAALLIKTGSGVHFVEPTVRCYSELGAKGLRESNIGGGTGAQAVLNFLTEGPGSELYTVHRQWLLYPALQSVGIGSTDTSTAIEVLGAPFGQGLDAFVSWPPSGYFPRQLEPGGLWSLSRDGANFTSATVTARVEGEPVTIRQVQYDTLGVGSPTLKWQLDLPNTHDDQRVDVTVSDILLGNGSRVDYSYSTVLIDANRPTSASSQIISLRVGCSDATPATGAITTVAAEPGDTLEIATTNCRYIFVMNGVDPVGTGLKRDPQGIGYEIQPGTTVRFFVGGPLEVGDLLVQLQLERDTDGSLHGPALVIQGDKKAGVQSGTRYRSCAQLRRDFLHGIASSRQAQRRSVGRGTYAPAVRPAIYAASPKKLDADRDGVMCAIRR